MTRARIHFVFACAALAFTLAAAYSGMRLQSAMRVNDMITGAGTDQFDASVAEAVFARALALSGAGDYRDAAKTYKALIQEGNTSDLRLAALYNLGNLYMREALKDGAGAAIHSLPLIELAKQSYRDLLRDEPGNWDARYNLERAIWLAPEESESPIDELGDVVWDRRVMRATPGFRIELP